MAAIKAQQQYDKVKEEGQGPHRILQWLPLLGLNERLVALVAMILGREDYLENAEPVAVGPDLAGVHGRSATVQTYFLRSGLCDLVRQGLTAFFA